MSKRWLAALALLLGILIAGAIVYASAAHRRQQRADYVRYVDRVDELETIDLEGRAALRVAELSGDPKKMLDAKYHTRVLTDSELAELAELRRRLAAMKADGIHP